MVRIMTPTLLGRIIETRVLVAKSKSTVAGSIEYKSRAA
jgi:hypothetical protein